MVTAFPETISLLLIREFDQVHLVEFPDSDTKICNELINALSQELGEKRPSGRGLNAYPIIAFSIR